MTLPASLSGSSSGAKARTSVRLVVLDVALGDHHPGVVTQCREQLNLGAVGSLRTPHRLAINRDPDQVRSRIGSTATTLVTGVLVVGFVRVIRVRRLRSHRGRRSAIRLLRLRC